MLFRKKREKKVKEKRTTDIQVIDEDWEPVKDAKVILFTGVGSGRIYHTNENGRCRVKLPPTKDFIEIKVVKKGKVRRANLYYLRNLKGKAARIKERK